MNAEAVAEELREERSQFARLWRQVTKAQRDAKLWIGEGADYWEESSMLDELGAEVDEGRLQPTQVLKALRAGGVSPQEAEATRMELCSKRCDLEQSLESIQVPDFRRHDAARARKLMSHG